MSKQSGFSLIEIMVIMAVIGILVVFAVMLVGSASNQIERQNVAKQLKIYLEKARFDSVKRAPTAAAERSRVVINSTSSFSVQTDLNQNGVLENIEIQQTTLANNIRLRDTGWNFPLLISFDKNGHYIATDNTNSPITPNFEICDKNCTDPSSTPANSNIISVSPTGTVILMSGGQTIPVYTNPVTTSVSPTTDVNPMVSVN